MSNDVQTGQGNSQGDDDVSLFGMENTAGQSELAIKVTRSNSRKMLVVVGIVVVLSFVTLFCIGAGVIGMIVFSRRSQQEEIAKKKELPPPVEMRAKIKNIDRSQRTIRL